MSVRRLLTALAVSLATLPGAAEEPTPDASTPDAVEERMPDASSSDVPQEPPPITSDAGTPPQEGEFALSLSDAISMGLENNLDVQVERYSPMIADFDAKVAWGAYDPTLFGEFGYSDTQTPTAFVLARTDESVVRSTDGLAGLQGTLPLLGTEYKAQFDGNRTTYNSAVQALSPEYNSGWALSVTQPLLRDLIWNEPWTQVRTTRLLLGSSEEDFRRAVMDEVQQIEDAYWALIAAEEAQRVATKSLETASALLEQTKTEYEVGVKSKVEVTEAEAGVSQRELELIRARNVYRNQQDVLIDLVLGPNLRATSTLELRPTDRPDDFVPYEVDVEAAVSQAFENRPEVARALREIERQEVQRSFARNQVLPALDGILSYGQKGLSGRDSPDNNPCLFSPDPACDPNQDIGQGGFDNTYDDYNDSPQLGARARLSIPFPNQAARGIASRREVELARARTQMRRLEQQIIIEVRQAARNLEDSQEGITAARNASRAAEEQLRAEQIRLEYGESTPFEVLQREEDLVERERDQIGAFQNYRTSVTALDRAQGTILRNRNINIADVAPLR